MSLSKIEALETVLAEFQANLRHDFRTPLNSIMSLSQMLLARLDGELTAEQAKQVEFIQKAAENLTALVNKMQLLAPEAIAPAVEKKIPAQAAAAGGTVRILMIDDNEVDRYVIRRLAARPGVELLEADSGMLGIELARAHKPDYILLDLSLPDATGFEILQSLKHHAETKNIPVIIHSSMALRPEEARLLQMHAAHVVSKDPAQAGNFHALLEKIFAGQAPTKEMTDA